MNTRINPKSSSSFYCLAVASDKVKYVSTKDNKHPISLNEMHVPARTKVIACPTSNIVEIFLHHCDRVKVHRSLAFFSP